MLLRDLGAKEVLVQAADGTLLLGPLGERTVNHYSFYAAFTAAEEYRLFTAGRPLGTMPADFTLYVGALLIFAGRRWKVTAVDHAHKIIEAMPAPGGRPPLFNGGIAGVHDRVRAEMRSVLAAEDIPRYLSDTAASLLSEARAAYTRYQLGDRSILQAGPHTLLLPWTGSKSVTTLSAQLCAAGLDASNDGLIITVASAAAEHVRRYLDALVTAGPSDPVALAATVANKEAAKYDEWIDDDLLAVDYARRALDAVVPGGPPKPFSLTSNRMQPIPLTARSTIDSTQSDRFHLRYLELEGTVRRLALSHVDRPAVNKPIALRDMLAHIADSVIVAETRLRTYTGHRLSSSGVMSLGRCCGDRRPRPGGSFAFREQSYHALTRQDGTYSANWAHDRHPAGPSWRAAPTRRPNGKCPKDPAQSPRARPAGRAHRAQHATMPPRPHHSHPKQRTATTPVTSNSTLTLAE